jgi:hypothetical protein
MLAQQHMMQMGREHMGMNVHPAMGHVQVRVGIGTTLSLYLVLRTILSSLPTLASPPPNLELPPLQQFQQSMGTPLAQGVESEDDRRRARRRQKREAAKGSTFSLDEHV